MKPSGMLTVTSLISSFLLSIHLTHDVSRGVDRAGLNLLVGVLIMVVFLCGTLLWADRIWGRLIVLLGSLFALGMPVLHWRGAGVRPEFAATSSGFLFVWTLYTLGVTGAFGLILSVLGLLNRPKA